ncbi:kinase-like domain-containing protein [Aspergillus unguis]
MLSLRLCISGSKRTIFSFARKSRWHLPPHPGPPIPQEQRIDEEKCPGYNPRSYYPAKPGEVLNDKYQLLVKAGFGTQSTVWIARDVSRFRWAAEEAVTIKIVNHNNSSNAQNEIEIAQRIDSTNPSHRGRSILRTCLDNFEVIGPEGKHTCLIYQPMREPLWLFEDRLVDARLPLWMAKLYIYILLDGLNYLHSECKIAHTDLNCSNVLMSFENDDVLPAFLEAKQPMEYKIDPETGRTIYLCHNNFAPLEDKGIKSMIPHLADFGNAIILDDGPIEDGKPLETVGLYPIHPDHYRAPEVILGFGWGFQADIWNLGVMIWNPIGPKNLFRQAQDDRGQYDAKAHLAEMIALLGPPPERLLTRANRMSKQDWPSPIWGLSGRRCKNSQEFFGGPFFGADGNFLYKGLIPDRSLEDTVPFLEGKDKEEFLSFARDMLVWHPADRKTPSELMKHPFLDLDI